MFHAKIIITLRKSILDPQGKAIEHGIHSLGYQVKNVRIGKYVEMDVDAPSKQEAERIVQEACQKLLANPVMEDASFTVEEVSAQVVNN